MNSSMDLRGISDEALGYAIADAKDTLDETKSAYNRLIDEVKARMIERGGVDGRPAKRLPHNDVSILSKTTIIYDQSRLTPLLEILLESELAECYAAPYVQQVDGRFDMRSLPKFVQGHGGPASEILNQAVIGPSITVEVKRK